MTRRAGPLAMVVLLAAVIALFVFGVARQGDDRTLDNAVSSGSRPVAPDRALPLLAGSGTRSLASYRGQVVVLNFWASWCDPCRAEVPLLERAAKRFTAGHGTVLGVTFRDTTTDSLAFARKLGITYPSVRDIDGKLAAAYGTAALPETFVIDRSGHVVAISRGQISERFLERAIAKAST